MAGASITLTRNRGVLCLLGDQIDALARNALESDFFKASGIPRLQYDPSSSYHVTLLSKAELRSVPEKQLADLLGKVDHNYVLHSAGIGGSKNDGVFYLVIIWVAGQQIRKKLGLPPKHFHLTISANDNHDMYKGIRSLFPGQLPQSPSLDFLDHLALTHQAFEEYSDVQSRSIEMIVCSPQSDKGFIRLSVAALAMGSYKLAMLALACAFDRTEDDKVKTFCTKKLMTCSEHTEWGAVFQEHELSQIPADIVTHLIAPWPPSLRQTLIDSAPTPSQCLQSRDALFVPKHASITSLDLSNMYKLPRFFRWLIPFRFSIMSTPRNEDDIRMLASSTIGIRRVLTLTEETPLDQVWFRGKTIDNTFLPIPNYHPPSIEQMDLVMRLFMEDDNLPFLVHCGGGKGRAGTVAACYMAACGFKSPSYEQTQPEMSGPEVITLLRSLRPGSIETSQQEAFVSKWCSTLWKRQSIFPDLPAEPPGCPMTTEGALNKDCDLFMFVGLPGSGKSWVSQSILARDPTTWVHISQDEIGSRSMCETAIGRVSKGKKAIFDRCNVSAADRKLWLGLSATWSTSPVCVWFDYDRELCESRAQLRAGHPTLPPGGRVRSAIDQMAKTFDKPSLKEGFKAIVTIRSFQAAQEFVSWISPPVTVYKFPRTPHLLDLGAATDDDIRSDHASLSSSLQGHVVVTEKIDGANMGFSLSSDRTQIVVQNRSHYVNSSSHEQFKKLGLWIERHKDELIKILDKDPYFPERYILFGEWMYATHSIPYTQLPDHFVAYDFYDRSTKSWMDSRNFRDMLAQTTIHAVPIVEERDALPSEAELKAMVQRQSAFYEGRVEGVYVKVERNGSVVYRAKVVRSDFIAGNEHWTRGGVRVNGLALDVS